MEQTTQDPLARYHRQMLVPQIGRAGQERLARAKIVLIGCGGLGGTVGQILARAGVGELVLCDSDTVQLDNLHRQLFFDERDLGKPKAIVAAAKLLMINSQVKLHARPIRVDVANLAELSDGADLIIDATDNLASRYAVNAFAVPAGRDWLYAGCIADHGTVMVVRSRTGGCLECLFGPFDPAAMAAGGVFPILPTTPVVVGAIEANEAIRYLLSNDPNNPCGSTVISIDLSQNRVHAGRPVPKNPDCRLCTQKDA